MSFEINTNIASLRAQNYLRTNSEFQTKTINRVTSGLRILSSGDDAAGLAIANGFRSDQAVLTQGIRNANDGLSALQTIDGGMNNISMLLDRARTLATQSASGTFNGDRGVLNAEFQSVLSEIDRQSQSIGLDSNGTFAKSLSVFIGGGRSNNGATAISNGSVAVDLSKSTVDSKSLGLKGVQSVGVSSIDIGTGSAHTTVAQIVGLAANQTSEATPGSTDFYFRGSGFSDANRVKISVNLTGVNDTGTLVTAINTAIQNAGNGTTQQATAFKNAGVAASVVTDTSGSHLAFTSSTSAFQVSAGDLTSNALLGNVVSTSDPTGKSLTNTVTGGSNTLVAAFVAANAGTVNFKFQGAGLTGPVTVSLAVTAAETMATALTALQTAVAANTSLQAAGITLANTAANAPLVFSSARGEQFTVATSGDISNAFGLGSFQSSSTNGTTGTFDYTTRTATAAGTFAAAAETLEFSIGGGTKISLAVTPSAATELGALSALNVAFAGNATLKAAGLTAVDNGAGAITIASNGINFRLASIGATNVFGFNPGFATNTGVAQTANVVSAATTAATFDANGAYQTGVLSFTGIQNSNDAQTLTLTSDNSSGVQQSLAINLQSATPNARTLDEAINTINTQLLQSNNPTLQKIVAVKEQVSGVDGIKFIGTNAFQAAVGASASGNGINGSGVQGSLQAAAVVGSGSTADIDSQGTAQTAVSALSTAVSTLGSAQAVVGKGQNQFNYAVNLAQSQLTNLAAAESRIRDADLASEAANLTKAQILLQAGTAALAQANSAPQAILALLRA